jgi:hypothetical protein
MGRLEIQIRHGHDGGGWGAAVALILLIAFAIGGAAHKQVTAAAHTVMTIMEIAAWTLAALVMLTAAAGLTWAGLKVRAAVRARARRAAPVITLNPGHYSRDAAHRLRPGATDDRPALDPPRRIPGSWPLPGQRSEVRPQNGADDDRRDP